MLERVSDFSRLEAFIKSAGSARTEYLCLFCFCFHIVQSDFFYFFPILCKLVTFGQGFYLFFGRILCDLHVVIFFNPLTVVINIAPADLVIAKLSEQLLLADEILDGYAVVGNNGLVR